MTSRRNFLELLGAGTAGMALLGAGLAGNVAHALQAAARREVFIGGRRIKVVDVHGHCVIPEVQDIVRNSPLAAPLKALIDMPGQVIGPQRVQYLDKEGIDVQVLSINAYWYAADQELAGQIVRMQNERLAAWCATQSGRFVGLASVALQYPELAAEQLQEAVSKLGYRGVSIGGSVPGVELSDRKFDPFWAKAQELGVLVFMHPQPVPGTSVNSRLEGKGMLGNIVGFPLETTVFLSHLIFNGTLDRFPGLRICSAHGGGFLGSYSGRSDALCSRAGGADCRALKKRPSEYFRQELLVDTMVFHEEGLRHLVAEAGASQILYGTDHPFDWPVGVDFVLNAPLSDADKEAILGGNAVRMLRIA